MSNFKETFFETIRNYFDTTTIHGFAILLKSKNVIESITWCLIIIMSISSAGFLIHQGLIEAEEDPIATTVDLIPLSSLPYPALTIDSDPAYNPWGFTQKMFNMLAFYGPGDEAIETKSKSLKSDFSKVTEEMTKELWSSLKKEFMAKNISSIQAMIDEDHGNNLRKVRSMIVAYAPVVTTLLEFELFEDFEKDVLIPFIQETLLNTISFKMYKHMDHFQSMIDTFVSKFNISSSSNSINEESLLKISYAALAAPFLINRYPFNYMGKLPYWSFGFGDYLSYFGRLQVDKTKALFSKKPGNMNQVESFMRNKLIDVVTKMSNYSTSNISSYEIASLLSTMPYIGTCPYYTNIGRWDRIKVRKCYTDDQKDSEIQECCNTLQLFDKDLETVLKIMRYSMQTPTYYEDFNEVEQIYGNLGFLGYDNLTDHKEKGPLMKTTKNPRVLLCKYQGLNKKSKWELDNCDLLQRSFTSTGVGFTFNQADFWSYMKANQYTKAFANVMTPKGYNKPKPKERESIYEGKGLHYFVRNGENGELTLILQANRLLPLTIRQEMDLGKPNQKKESIPYFRLKIHDPLSVANMNGALKIFAGTEVSISITPSQIVTSNDLESLSETKRKCRSHQDTKHSNLFEIYRQDSCHLECQMREVEHQCHCSPWEYPSINTSLPICNGFDKCTQDVLSDTNIEDQCYKNCPVDCTLVRYSKVATSNPINFERICKTNWKRGKEDDILEYALKETLGGDGAEPSKFIRNFQQLVFDKDIGKEELCMENLQKVAIVRLSAEDRLVQSIKRSRRVRITDHFSNIGGTLGLFCGISIISIFEVLFWSCRLLQTKCGFH